MIATVLLIYSLISGALLSLLWATFRLAGVNRLTCHKLNRMVLVLVLLASAALPAIAFIERAAPVVAVAVEAEPENMTFNLMVADVNDAAPMPSPTLGSRIVAALPTIYVIGASVSLFWLLMALGGVAASIIRGERRRLDGNTTLVVVGQNITPFTWGRWIVISRADLDANAEMLLIHEKAHRVALHWLDLLLARLVTCLDWYWPTAWMLSRDLAAVHEFEADSRVLGIGTDAEAYQMLLIRKGASGFFSNITNPFNYSSLKKRITMMQKKQSVARLRMRYLAILPAAALAIFISASPALATAVSSAMPVKAIEPEKVVEQADTTAKYYVRGIETDKNNEQKKLIVVDGVASAYDSLSQINKDKIMVVNVNNSSDAVEKYGQAAKNGVIEVVTVDAPEEIKAKVQQRLDSSETLTAENAVKVSFRTQEAVEPAAEVVKTAPSFPGGDSEMYKFLARNIRYPEAAAAKNIQGRVVVKFKVQADGSISDANVHVGVDSLLDAEAVRVINRMSKFNPATENGVPVASWYTLPISFRISGPSPKKTDSDGATTVEPEYPGGKPAMMKFLMDNLKYPAKAVEAKAEGTVSVGVCFNDKGKRTAVGIADNPTGNSDLANEAYRVVNAMPEFKPATRNGQPVEYYMTIPVSFKLK